MQTLTIDPQILKNTYLEAINKQEKISYKGYYNNFSMDYFAAYSVINNLETLIKNLTGLTINQFLEIY